MVEQLQQSPSDDAMREKIIKLARQLKPAPAVPDAAVEFEGRAQFAFNNAQSKDDYLAAAREYERAVTDAPWVSGYYADLCTIYEKAGKFAEAKRNCEFSLIGLADAAQITDIKRRIAGLKYGIELKAKKTIEGFWKLISQRSLYFKNGNADGLWRDIDYTNDFARYPLVYEIRKSGARYEVVGIRGDYMALKTLSSNDENIQFIDYFINGGNGWHRNCHLDGDDLFCTTEFIEIESGRQETTLREESRFRKQSNCDRLGPNERLGVPIKCK